MTWITDLDGTVHQRVRLSILAALSGADRIEFTTLRDLLFLSSGSLSTHLRVLDESGLVRLTRTAHRGRRCTWVSMTDSGVNALDKELEALQAVARQVSTGRLRRVASEPT